jgi:hypothetical protein
MHMRTEFFMRALLVISLLTLILIPPAPAQDAPVSAKEMRLVELYRSLNEHRFSEPYERFDSTRIEFANEMEHVLSLKESISYPFDSLSKHIRIARSEDKKLRIFSWDDLSGGTWHAYTSRVQYVDENGNPKVTRIDTGKEGELGGYTDALIDAVYSIVIADTLRYLAIGYGTHGSGEHFSIALVLTPGKNGAEICTTCFEGVPYVVNETKRIYKPRITFHQDKKTLSYKGFDENTGKEISVTWKITGEKFSKQVKPK